METSSATALDGTIEFDGSVVTITRSGRRAKKNPPFAIPIDSGVRAFFRAPKGMALGQLAVIGRYSPDPKRIETGPRIVMFAKSEAPAFEALYRKIDAAISDLTPQTGTDEQTSSIADAVPVSRGDSGNQATIQSQKTSGRDRIFAEYKGHIVDQKGYRFGFGVKRPLDGAESHFESGADRSRPTLTRIGAGAILAGPAGAVVGGLFKKDKTKCYVTIVFPDGASVIIDGPAKDEKKMRKFSLAVNSLAAS